MGDSEGQEGTHRSGPADDRSDPLRLAVVGLGWAGTRQTEAAGELGRDVEVVALVDNDAEFLAARSDALGVDRTYQSLDAALREDDIEAISICTPHALHAEQCLKAVAAGRHVLVEKPMAMTVAEATRMIEAADAAGVVLYVAESECYMPYAVSLRTIVETGEPIGELTFASLVSGYRATDPRYPGRREWLTVPGLGGTGTWYLQGIHAVAALRYVLGEVAAIGAREHRTSSFDRPELEATMSTLIELESGLAVSFTQTTETNIPRHLRGFQLYGERGVVVGGRLGGFDLYPTERDQDAASSFHAYPQGLSEYALELEAFAATVGGRAHGPTDGRSERRSLAVLEAGLESARSGERIVVLERFPELLGPP